MQGVCRLVESSELINQGVDWRTIVAGGCTESWIQIIKVFEGLPQGVCVWVFLKTQNCKESLEGANAFKVFKGGSWSHFAGLSLSGRTLVYFAGVIKEKKIEWLKFSVGNSRNHEDHRIQGSCRVLRGRRAYHSRIQNQLGPLIVIFTSRQIISAFRGP